MRKGPTPCSVISIDVGHRRIGLAGCDPLGITVKPLKPMKRGSLNEDLSTLKKHCETRKVQGLVIGIPFDESGGITQQALHCKNYGKKIARSLKLPIAWVNENSSTWEASQRYKIKNDRSGKLDSLVAVLLLEQWLREGPELKPIDISTPNDCR